MRSAKHAFIVFACVASIEVADFRQHNVAGAEVTGAGVTGAGLSSPGGAASPAYPAALPPTSPSRAQATGPATASPPSVSPVTVSPATASPVTMNPLTTNQTLANQTLSQPVDQVGARPSAKATLLNSRSFNIPFTVDASGTQPAKVQLFVARYHSDQPGAAIQWELFNEARPEAKHFEFTAPSDGLYLFTTRTIDVTGRPHPVGNTLEVVINTEGPDIKLDADTDASGRVDLVYIIQDASPLTEVQLQYMTDVERVWRPIEHASVKPSEKVSFMPVGSWDQISVQATVVDAAGNRKTTRRMIQRPRVAAVPTNRFSSTGTDTPTARPTPYRIPSFDPDRASPDHVSLGHASPEGSVRPFHQSLVGQPVQWSGAGRSSVANSSGGVTVTAVPSGAAASEPPRGFENIPLPTGTPVDSTNDAGAIGLGLEPPRQSATLGGQEPTTSSTAITPWNAVTETASPDTSANRPRTPAEAMRPLDTNLQELTGSSTSNGQLPSTGMSLPSPGTERTSSYGSTPLEQIPLSEDITQDTTHSSQRAASGLPVPMMIDTRVPLRYSESARFSLEYELEAVGSGGVEAVELWGSIDGGASWKRWGSDPDRQSPFDIETNGEGTYAFRIVVVSSSGLASPRPLPGELADIAVTVDTTKPDVKITGAKYGERDRVGSLVIKYACVDQHLLPRPIALAFSETPDGPWTTIASGLNNEGEYVWPADPQLPRQFYLRIDSTDAAGNVGSYVLDQPIDAQGLAPRARIRGLQSLTGATPPAADDQTANLPAATFK